MGIEKSEKKNTEKKKRIEIIDALRGFSVLLMVCHHFIYDAVHFLGLPDKLFSNPVFDVLQTVFAGVFICLCGVSSNFSRSNLKRGLFTLVVAICVTGVTALMDMPIVFGVLHLLSFCMLFYGLTHKLWEKMPKTITAAVCVIGIFVSVWCVNNIEVQSDNLWIFGWQGSGFVSYDYFPLLPWFFVFMSGTAIGHFIRENKFPKWFYDVKIPVLPVIGRHTMIIYIVHQPVLYGITMLIKFAMHNAL